MQVAKVAVLNTNRDSFDYLFDDQPPCIGGRVWVPFRNTTRLGLVTGIGKPEKANLALKSIASKIDDSPLLSEDMLNLCYWISRYYQAPLSEVFALAIPKKYREGGVCELPTQDYYALQCMQETAHQQLSKRATRQHQLIDYLAAQENKSLAKKRLIQAGFNLNQIHGLVEKGILSQVSQIEKPQPSLVQTGPLQLNVEQALALQTMIKSLNQYQCFLLQGVTGSGKTEVYLQLIAEVLNNNRQVLILVPEIGLTPQLLARFQARFKESMVVIHSHLNDTERQVAWQLARDDEVKLVIGTRSAIFTPMPSLGLIVIDEEHDLSLKQMEGVRYSARDTALIRAHAANIPIVLGSATPSLESLHNCAAQKYVLLRLNQKALSTTPLHYAVVDIRDQVLQQGLADTTLKMISEHLQQHNQVLIFINRRGFSPVLLCHQCGWMADCSACDSHLTFHRTANQLICHHCGLTCSVLRHCQACKSGELLPIGVGTQRIEDYLSRQFPTTSILRVDRDEVSKKNAIHAHLTRIHEGDAQLIIGTQMLAKGHHFPRLTLVVVLDTDNGFYNQDFRALERLGQLLTQVAGRAGRAELPGQVVIQTHLPQHPLLNLLIKEGYESFAESLLAMRQEAALPPYHFLAMLRAQGNNQAKVLTFMHAVKDHLNASDIHVFGPAPAPLARKARQHRMQLMIKASSRKKLSQALTPMREWLVNNKLSSGLRWNIDVDPMDLS